jgi:AcrR family transcriptional regulator
MTSARAPGRPRDAAIDEAILLAAWEQLTAVGYAALTMTAVAEAAGVQKPALYRRWPTKALLAIDALAVHLPSLTYRDLGSLEADLADLLRQLGRTWRTPVVRRSLSPLLADIDADADAQAAFVERVRIPRTAAMRAALARAAERGELRPDAPLDVVADLLEGPLMHRAVLGRNEVDAPLVEAVLTSCLTLLRRG